MGNTISVSAPRLQHLSRIMSSPDIRRVSTLSTKVETWIDVYRNKLIEDRLLPVGKIVLASEYDPTDEQTADIISGVHALVNNGLVNEVHYTEAASSYPLLGIFKSSAHPKVQFIQLDGDF